MPTTLLVERAGGYANERYSRAHRNWRRRELPPLLVRVVPLALASLGLAYVLPSRGSWFAAGFTAGAAVILVLVEWLYAPEHVLRWKRGALGEEATADLLAPLLAEGWEVRHDIPHALGNADHVLIGPRGVFLLETKNLGGVVTVDGGVLTTRRVDDPDTIWRGTSVAWRLRKVAAELCDHIETSSGVRPWVQPVVVIWGDFATQHVEADGVAYVAGRNLVPWLRGRPQSHRQVEFID